MIIQGYKVTSNHATGTYPASARVKDADGVLIAKVVAPRGDVLSYIRMNPLSDERKLFVTQLIQADVPFDVIQEIISVPKGK